MNLAVNHLHAMSKRKNPFGEVAPIQLKMHVSAKHVAISQQDMENVYSELKNSVVSN